MSVTRNKREAVNVNDDSFEPEEGILSESRSLPEADNEAAYSEMVDEQPPIGEDGSEQTNSKN